MMLPALRARVVALLARATRPADVALLRHILAVVDARHGEAAGAA